MTPLGHALRWQGEGTGAHGEMASVLRVFNDSVGVVKFEKLDQTTLGPCTIAVT